MRTQKTYALAALAAALCSATPRAAPAAETATAAAGAGDIERGRYLVSVGGCNDCHTPGFMEMPGMIEESEWLSGVPLGWRGPWGTTYAANLRLRVHEMTEDEWVVLLRTRKSMPPMPWFSVNAMTEPDARAMYRYIRGLGPKGGKMPGFTPPDEEPVTPYLSLNPQAPERPAPKELRRETPARAP